MVMNNAALSRRPHKKSLAFRIWDARYLYLLVLPAIAWYVIWCYIPMDGVLLAFKKYSAKLGVLGSEWIGLKNFQRIFVTNAAVKSIFNTLEISFARLIIEFPMPILLAILLNEVNHKQGKKVLQTVYTFPHFLSWVIVASICKNFFAASGFFNSVIKSLGGETVNFLANKNLFRPLLYFTSIWKEAGWSSIIFLASISSIDPTLYEAAEIDGANRLQQAWYITVSCIRETIVLMFIMAVGGVMNAGFDQIFNMMNGAVQETVEIIDTYIYNISFEAKPDYGFSGAIGIFKSIINLMLMCCANFVCKKLTGSGLFK